MSVVGAILVAVLSLGMLAWAERDLSATRARRRCERAEQVLEQAVQGLEELEPVVTADATS